MCDEDKAALGGLTFGVLLGATITLFIIWATGTTLQQAQRQYRECIALQAPKEICLKTYLLPRGEKTP